MTLAKLLLGSLLMLSVPAVAADPASDPYCYDADKVFKRCQNQNDLFVAGKNKALQSGKRLLLVYGYESCPWSNAIIKALHFSQFADEVRDAFVVVPITASQFYTSGKELMKTLMLKLNRPEAQEWGLPILAVMNPATEKADLIRLAPFERNTQESDLAPSYRGYHVEQVMEAIRQTNAKLN